MKIQNEKEVVNIKKSNIPLWIRFRLLFVKQKTAIDIAYNGDSGAYVHFKVLDGITYITEIKEGSYDKKN